ncbi:hypothetical protein CAXC1_20009 [Candidatus Xenohaliotis californiensis]|uniref:Uncharacterized protein n=1 Tax=Candidatus Xenohaliotis californiensis TaxID=84677 RepID=A0ABP0EW52_9RICK|nr:hypothetical protein CAXC1_20009 [Candidatus Xenohaliotis californiensis]
MSNLILDHSILAQEQWENFTETNHNTWNFLFERQIKLLQNQTDDEVVEGMNKLRIYSAHILKFSDLNKILQPEDLFFKFLSERKFPSTLKNRCNLKVMDGVGFEPTVQIIVLWFSRPVLLTTQSPIHSFRQLQMILLIYGG